MENRGQRTVTIKAHAFDWHDKIGYMFGDIGNNFSFSVVNSFLMIFYTNVYVLTGTFRRCHYRYRCWTLGR